MKIESINVQNVLGIQRFEIDQAKPITLVAGGNEAGKSSLLDAISMALTGQPRRVTLKKELGRLINDRSGAKKGSVLLTAGESVVGEIKLPKGEHSSTCSSEFLPLVLDTYAFASLSADDRRRAMFSLADVKPSAATIKAELEHAKCQPKLIEQIMGLARAGFPTMHDEAKANATKAKGAWKAATGETWGSDKADGWKAEVPAGEPVTAEQVAAAKAEADKIQRDIENGMAHKGKLEAQQQAAERTAGLNAAAKEKREALPRLQAKADATRADLAQWEVKLQSLTEQMSADDVYPCPCCDANLQLVDGKLVKAGGSLGLAERKQLKEDHDKATEAVELYRRTLANDERAIHEAESAVLAEEDWPTDGELERTIEAITRLRTNLAAAQAKHAALADRNAAIAGANDTTLKAAEHHAEVVGWLELADQLAPSGIPGRLLAKALQPFNEKLASLASVAGWMPASIDSDMTISYAGRPLELCSESGKWRACVMLQLAIAIQSEIRMATIDRFDVLSVPARPGFCKLADHLATEGEIDTLIVCGTLKEAPRMPANWASLWIENGSLIAE